MILGATPVFWVRDPLYIWVVIATALIGMWMVKLPRRMPGMCCRWRMPSAGPLYRDWRPEGAQLRHRADCMGASWVP